MNKRQMEQAMRKMGIQQQEVDASEVIIKLNDGKEIVISRPSVQKVNMMGQKTYQIAGTEAVREASAEPEISEDDVQTVMEQAGVNEETAREAIAKNKGDLALAILDLKKE